MLRSFIRNIAVVSLLAGFTSCSVFTDGTKQRAEHPLQNAQKMIDPATGKEVVFIWMQHLSTHEGYAQIRDFLDRLKAGGYVTFCEGVIPVPFHIDTVGEVTMRQLREKDYTLSADDSLRLDALYRKCRRMLGYMIGKRGYADPDNESLKTKDKTKGYVPQSEERLGLTTDKDIWADYSLQDIVGICERKYGEIPLTPLMAGGRDFSRNTHPISVRRSKCAVISRFSRATTTSSSASSPVRILKLRSYTAQGTRSGSSTS